MEAATGAASAVNNAAAKSVVSRPQQTLRQSVAVVGKGYWSGVENRVELRPSAAGSGIRFIREDLGGACVPVSLKNRVAATKRTNLRVGQVAVEMVEHLLSALSALGVDCCEVGLTAAELPGLDGSARAYVEAIDSVGVQPLSGSLIEPLVVQSPFTIAEDSSSSLVEVHPPTTDGLRVSYFVEYPGLSIWPQHY